MEEKYDSESIAMNSVQAIILFNNKSGQNVYILPQMITKRANETHSSQIYNNI